MSRRRVWNVGDECLVTPDLEHPERKVRGVVVGLREQGKPLGGHSLAVKCVGDPVWDGQVLFQRGGSGSDAVRVELIA